MVFDAIVSVVREGIQLLRDLVSKTTGGISWIVNTFQFDNPKRMLVLAILIVFMSVFVAKQLDRGIGSFSIPDAMGLNETSPNEMSNINQDLDNDGTPDKNDPDIDGDGLLNNEDPDIDGDGIPNHNDPTCYGENVEGQCLCLLDQLCCNQRCDTNLTVIVSDSLSNLGKFIFVSKYAPYCLTSFNTRTGRLEIDDRFCIWRGDNLTYNEDVWNCPQDCEGTGQPMGYNFTDLCFNGVKDAIEDGVDCGGPCPGCECLTDEDCLNRDYIACCPVNTLRANKCVDTRPTSPYFIQACNS